MCRYENLYQDNNPKITQTIDFFGEDHLLIALLDILIKYWLMYVSNLCNLGPLERFLVGDNVRMDYSIKWCSISLNFSWSISSSRVDSEQITNLS